MAKTDFFKVILKFCTNNKIFVEKQDVDEPDIGQSFSFRISNFLKNLSCLYSGYAIGNVLAFIYFFLNYTNDKS